jgi:hypothetical protein
MKREIKVKRYLGDSGNLKLTGKENSFSLVNIIKPSSFIFSMIKVKNNASKIFHD